MDQLIEAIFNKQKEEPNNYGGRVVGEQFVNELLSILFPGYYTDRRFESKAEIEDRLQIFFVNAKRAILPYLTDPKLFQSPLESSEKILKGFREALPKVYESIWEDAKAAYHWDPAAESIKEVILAYPGFFAIAVYRIAHVFFQLGIPIFPRILSEFAHEKTGIDIHPGAQIGSSFFMDHGSGIVIGGTSIIEKNVRIFQGVTLGALSVSKELAKVKRHPTIQENVVIYSGATILGGETIIGRNSVIGGNAWVTQSVPPFSLVFQKNEIKVRNTPEMDDVIDFSI